jgi:hypothetical protein
VRDRTLERQLPLFEPDPRALRLAAAGQLADALAALLGEPVKLAVHDNRSTMFSFRRRTGLLCCRAHHMFLEAPDGVVSALADFAAPSRRRSARRREAGRVIDGFVREHRARIGAPRLGPVEPRGRHHDLQPVFDRLNAEHFGGAVEARIGWGAWRGGRRRRTIRTGVYLHDARLIRIHPSLDRREVPEFYLGAVVFHEMLHQVVPVAEVDGRRVVHGPEFRRRERAYPYHAWARAWEQANFRLLLERARS